MKTLKFKDSGVLWRLATVYGPLNAYFTRRDGTDICSFTRAVLVGLLMVLLTIAVGTGIGWVVIDTIMFWAFWLVTTGPMSITVGALLGSALIMVGVVVTAIWYIGDLIKTGIERLRDLPPSEPGTIRQMYRSWKEKHCSLVTFGDTDAS